jgi:multidrug efflux pump subunit AcrA (membrane-fusion protein)
MSKNRLPFVAGIMALFAAASIVHTRTGRQPSDPPLPPPASHYSDSVGGTGIVEATTENIAVGTPVGGLVSDIYVKVEDTVRAGDPLFKIDTRIEDAELIVKRAAIVSAEAKVKSQEAILADLANQSSRTANLFENGIVSIQEWDRVRFAAESTRARLAQAKADLNAARAAVKVLQVEIDRRTVRAPVDGRVLQVKVHLGEFAATGALSTPLMILGAVDRPNVRVDIDEQNAWRVPAGAPAIASIRGNANLKLRLEFVRFEPYVVPKKSLTGDTTERVDMRVLQVIYRIAEQTTLVRVGQQLDVFIDLGQKGAPP